MMYWKELGHAISFDLAKNPDKNPKYNGFYVECMYLYDKNKEKYRLSMSLKYKDIPDKFKIETHGIDTQYITSTRENVRENIARIVEQACKVGFFEPYIDAFNYTYACCDKGSEILDAETA